MKYLWFEMQFSDLFSKKWQQHVELDGTPIAINGAPQQKGAEGGDADPAEDNAAGGDDADPEENPEDAAADKKTKRERTLGEKVVGYARKELAAVSAVYGQATTLVRTIDTDESWAWARTAAVRDTVAAMAADLDATARKTKLGSMLLTGEKQAKVHANLTLFAQHPAP